MPSEEAHAARAAHNSDFLASIESKKFCDWKAIVAFYVAVHLVEGLFARAGIHNENHDQRNRYLKTRYPKLWKPFHSLWGYAVYCRYICKPISVQRVEEELLAKSLPAVKRLVKEEAARFGRIP